MRTLSLLVALGIVAAGCGASRHAQPAPVVKEKDWVAVIDDWLDNRRIDGQHSCGAVVEAVAHVAALEHLPSDSAGHPYKLMILAFDRYASGACPKHPQLSKIAAGMTNGEVARIAGMPRTPRLRCWLYPVTREHQGRRVCFVNGRASTVLVSLHG